MTIKELRKLHHCELFNEDGAVKWRGIDRSMIEYIEIGGTYIEASNGCSYDGLDEPFVLSIGQSFKDLLREYGKKHIYDAIDDGKLAVFDSQRDLEEYLRQRFDICDERSLLLGCQKAS